MSNGVIGNLTEVLMGALDGYEEKVAFVEMGPQGAPQGGMPPGAPQGMPPGGDPMAGGGMPPGMPPGAETAGGGMPPGMPPEAMAAAGGGGMPPPEAGGPPPGGGGDPAAPPPEILEAMRVVLLEVLPQVLPQALQMAGVAGGGEEEKKTEKPKKPDVTALEQRISQLEQQLGIPQGAPTEEAQGGAGAGADQPAMAAGPLSPEAGGVMNAPMPPDGLIQTAGVLDLSPTRSDALHTIGQALVNAR